MLAHPNRMPSPDVSYVRGTKRIALTRLDLDTAKFSQSHTHPTLCTIVVDASTHRKSATPPNEHHWRLPSTDTRDEGKFLFRLHTIDLYFWTVDDAALFVRSAQATLAQEQLNVEAAPGPEPHEEVMSPRRREVGEHSHHRPGFPQRPDPELKKHREPDCSSYGTRYCWSTCRSCCIQTTSL
jgi:hypothetical protein